MRYKSLRHGLSHGMISVDFAKLENNIADPLTKGLTYQKVIESSRGMGLNL